MPAEERSADGRAGETEEYEGVGSESSELRPLSLDEAISILGEETRARIVVELGDAWQVDEPGPAYLSFSELMDRVGAEDSGRFNYHLDKLVGTFVSKSDEGYTVTQPGKILHQAIVAGTFTDRDRVESVPVDDCPTCDGTLTATYRSDQILVTECTDCERGSSAVYVPPRAFDDRDVDGVMDVAAQLTYHDVGLYRRGVCHGCGGAVERDLATSVPDVWPDEFDFDVFATLVCRECKDSYMGHPATMAMTTLAAKRFCAEHDRDPMLVPAWDDLIRDAMAGTTVTSESPLEVAIPFELDGERQRVVLDDDLQVVAAERTSV